eukprot:TRINITY_DN55795_c0_g1_i1.p1 TRINITY_DN55795_c0_g1~~TRINITY_DN55795_c0_g1_i1.p1  ORF type:complete len:645 (-),score=62.39 TRINITY_DN55795_c0_g1_i1:21-1928(-)
MPSFSLLLEARLIQQDGTQLWAGADLQLQWKLHDSRGSALLTHRGVLSRDRHVIQIGSSDASRTPRETLLERRAVAFTLVEERPSDGATKRVGTTTIHLADFIGKPRGVEQMLDFGGVRLTCWLSLEGPPAEKEKHPQRLLLDISELDGTTRRSSAAQDAKAVRLSLSARSDNYSSEPRMIVVPRLVRSSVVLYKFTLAINSLRGSRLDQARRYCTKWRMGRYQKGATDRCYPELMSGEDGMVVLFMQQQSAAVTWQHKRGKAKLLQFIICEEQETGKDEVMGVFETPLKDFIAKPAGSAVTVKFPHAGDTKLVFSVACQLDGEAAAIDSARTRGRAQRGDRKLPEWALRTIIGYLENNDVLRLRMVCRAWQSEVKLCANQWRTIQRVLALQTGRTPCPTPAAGDASSEFPEKSNEPLRSYRPFFACVPCPADQELQSSGCPESARSSKSTRSSRRHTIATTLLDESFSEHSVPDHGMSSESISSFSGPLQVVTPPASTTQIVPPSSPPTPPSPPQLPQAISVASTPRELPASPVLPASTPKRRFSFSGSVRSFGSRSRPPKAEERSSPKRAAPAAFTLHIPTQPQAAAYPVPARGPKSRAHVNDASPDVPWGKPNPPSKPAASGRRFSISRLRL